MQQINQDITNNTYKSIYLLYGQEAYLRVQYKNKLVNALVSADDTMNYNYYEGKNVNVGEVIDLAETMPFLSQRRVIVLENTGLVKAGGEQLAEYVGAIPESTVIIMAETEIDKRSKLYKAISKSGHSTEFDTQSAETLTRWVISKMKAERKRVTGHTIDVFLETVGSDMSNISTELEKLFSYTLNKEEITLEDIKAVCSVQLSNRIFEMIGAIACCDGKKALQIYHELLELKESPFGILALLVRQFNNMLQIEELGEKRCSDKQIAEKTGLAPFVINKIKPQIQNFTHEQMIDILERCASYDHEIKKGNFTAEMAIEMLIIECSSKQIGVQ